MKNWKSKISAALIGVALAGGEAMAAVDLSTTTVDLGPLEVFFGGVIVPALLVMFVIRKITKTSNRT